MFNFSGVGVSTSGGGHGADKYFDSVLYYMFELINVTASR
jgi:hypothetical protein